MILKRKIAKQTEGLFSDEQLSELLQFVKDGLPKPFLGFYCTRSGEVSYSAGQGKILALPVILKGSDSKSFYEEIYNLDANVTAIAYHTGNYPYVTEQEFAADNQPIVSIVQDKPTYTIVGFDTSVCAWETVVLKCIKTLGYENALKLFPFLQQFDINLDFTSVYKQDVYLAESYKILVY